MFNLKLVFIVLNFLRPHTDHLNLNKPFLWSTIALANLLLLLFYYLDSSLLLFFYFSISSNNSKSFLWQRPAWMFIRLGSFVKILLTFYINISSTLNCYGFEYFKKHSRTVNCSFNQSTFLFAWKEKKCHLLLRSPFLNRGLSDGQKFWNNLCLAKVFFIYC